MSEMNRRSFLVAAGVTAAAVLSLPVLQAHGEPPALPTSKPSKPIDIGPLKSFDKDGVNSTWAKRPTHFFVIRDGGKLFASTSLCTHRNRPLVVKADELYCPAHKSEFTFQGTVTGGPAQRSLPRFGISVNDAGHVMVDCLQEFSEAKWDDAASFISIPA